MRLGKLTQALHACLGLLENQLEGAARDWWHDELRGAVGDYRLGCRPSRVMQGVFPTKSALLLLGPHGPGKTTGAMMAAECTPSGGLLVSAHALSARWDESDPEVCKAYTTRRVLVLDDLGKAGEHDRMVGRLSDICDFRHSLGLKTIITTNRKVDYVAKRYGHRFIDRLNGYGAIVDCGGPSLRGNEPPVHTFGVVDIEVEQPFVPTLEQWVDLYDRLRGGL